MEKKIFQLGNKGMIRDTSISKRDNEHAYENFNIRITANERDTLLTVTNERGHINTGYTVTGFYVGHYVIDKDLIVFSTYDGTDYITKIRVVEATKHIMFASSSTKRISSFSVRYVDIPDTDDIITLGELFDLYPSFKEIYVNELIDKKKFIEVDIKYSNGSHETVAAYLSESVVIEDDDEGGDEEGGDDDSEKVVDEERIAREKLERASGIIYKGYLNLSVSHKLDTLGYVETSDCKKVYWVDGVNPSRMIDICRTYPFSYSEEIDTQFDFMPAFNVKTGVTSSIEKTFDGSGLMPSGSLQYFLTFHNLRGAETAIVWASELCFPSYSTRGGSPEETNPTKFTITLGNIDKSFEYARLYAYGKTSEDGSAFAYIVGDVKIESSTVSFIDNGANHTDIDASMLLYLGGQEFIAETLAEKNGKLFLGNISYPEADESGTLDEIITRTCIAENGWESNIVDFNAKTSTTVYDRSHGTYDYNVDLTSDSRGFKCNEKYRFGIQFIKADGAMSRAYWIGDKINTTYPYISGTKRVLPRAEINELPQELIDYASQHYKFYRLMYVVPSYSDRSVKAQGIVNPTMFKLKTRVEGNTYAMASWISRPINGFASYQHLQPIGPARSMTGEVQCVDYKEEPVITEENMSEKREYDHIFYIDEKVVTLNSPDEDVTPFSDDTKFRIIGGANVTKNTFSYTLKGSNILSANGGPITGLVSALETQTLNIPAWRDNYPIDFSAGGMVDVDFNWAIGENRDALASYYMYMWHAQGSIIARADDNGNKYSVLESKLYANRLFCKETTYFNTPDVYEPIAIKRANNTAVILDDKAYLKDVDIIASPEVSDGELQAYSVYLTLEDSSTYTTSTMARGLAPAQAKNDSVRIKYKSPDHIVIMNDRILPRVNNSYSYAYNKSTYGIDAPEDNINQPDFEGADFYMFIGEVYKEFDGTEYGGYTADAIAKNVFVPISEYTSLTKNKCISNDGDTYYQRYDCMKTTPYTNEDVNQVMDITSVMIETHVNLDGRYDSKRYTDDLLVLDWADFAPLNTAYSSHNNLISASTLDERFRTGDYPTMVIHSLVKEANSEVDTWTNVTMASSLNLDGKHGPLNALRRYSSNIYAFQDKAISQIMYNERTQLATNIGLPVEILNSQTVDGYQIITDKYGSKHRRSIVGTKTGLYFYDQFNGVIASFAEGIQPLSTQKGFDVWVRSNNGNYESWYDGRKGDIYFVNQNTTKPNVLCYNEYLAEFTSFYNYGNVNLMEQIGKSFYSLKSGSIWNNNVGRYNDIYGEIQGFYTDYKITPDPYGDKVFTNIDYRADFFDYSEYLPNETFDKVSFDNEYQHSEMVPGTQKRPSINTVRKKFRLWKMDIPRTGNHNLDWIRNPWVQMRLSKESPGTNRMEFHNLNVIYYE